jgi:hypothetical protein
MPLRRDMSIAARASLVFGPVKTFAQQTRMFSDAGKNPAKSVNKDDSSAEAQNAELRCGEIMASIVMTLFGLYLGFSAAWRLRRYLEQGSAKSEVAKLRRRETELQGLLERFKCLTELEGGQIPARFEKPNQERGIEWSPLEWAEAYAALCASLEAKLERIRAEKERLEKRHGLSKSQ